MSKRRAVLLVLAIPLAVLLFFGVQYASIYNRVSNGLQEKSVDALDEEAPVGTGSPSSAGPVEHILVIGSDSREGTSSADSTPGARSDSMMLVTISGDRKHLTGVSIPRDLMVQQAPSCNWWDAATREQSSQRWEPSEWTQANAPFAVGGPRCAVAMVEKLTDLKVTRYVEVDFAGFKALVDALGGVDVNICAPMVDAGVGVLFDKPGVYHIDGTKALQFARARKVEGDSGSDTSRMERQQYLLTQLLAQRLSPAALADPGTVSRLADVFVANSRTDNVDMSFLMSMATDARGLETTSFFTLPTREWEQDNNRLIDTPEVTRWLFGQMKEGKPVSPAQIREQVRIAKGVTAAPTAAAPSSAAPTASSSATSTPVSTTTTSASVAPSANGSLIPCGWGG